MCAPDARVMSATIGALDEWGLQVESDEIIVNSQLETGASGLCTRPATVTRSGKTEAHRDGFW